MQNWSGCSSLTQDNGSNGNNISITLTDSRDNNSYTVAKLKDGKCWMTQNLRIVGSKTLTSTNSDISSGNFSLPSSSLNFSGTNNNSSYFRSDTNSGYYSWYTATAGTGTNTLSSGEASNSICPKGWKLPTKSEMDAFASYYNYTTVQQSPVNFTFSGCGQCDQSPSNNTPYTHGSWYSSTSLSNNDANVFYLNGPSSQFTVASTQKYFGNPIRCLKR